MAVNFELSQGNLNFWKKSGNFKTTGHIFLMLIDVITV